MKIYIAGKITGDQGYQAKFQRAATGLRMCGNIVLNPADLPEGMEAADGESAYAVCADPGLALPSTATSANESSAAIAASAVVPVFFDKSFISSS